MQQIRVVDSPSFDNIILNIEDCAKEFLKDGVVAYRNANFSKEQQLSLMTKLGDFLGWSPNSSSKRKDFYEENHARLGVEKKDRKTKDDIILRWHMEHTEYKNPIVGATWNMHLFTCDPSIGRTGFVDTTKIYKELIPEWQEFLSNCVEIVTKTTSFDQESNSFVSETFEIPCVENHWITNEPTVRIDLDNEDVIGIKFKDKKEVTAKDLELFSSIKKFVISEIFSNNNNLLTHEWNQGDIIIVDLFKMAHSVFGGFYPEERGFYGYWAYRDEHE